MKAVLIFLANPIVIFSLHHLKQYCLAQHEFEDLVGRRLNRVQDDDSRKMWIWVSVGLTIFIIIVIGVIWFVAARMYKSGVTDQRKAFFVNPAFSMANGADFKYNICGCCDDRSQCLHALCCADLRIADTYSTTGLNGYWQMVLIILAYFEITQLCGAILGYILAQNETPGADNASSIVHYIFGALFAIYMGSLRGKLRQLYGGEPNCAMDWVIWWCCSCCAVVQEARQLDESTGQTPQCCCKLIETSGANSGMVGQPVVGHVVGVADKQPEV